MAVIAFPVAFTLQVKLHPVHSEHLGICIETPVSAVPYTARDFMVGCKFHALRLLLSGESIAEIDILPCAYKFLFCNSKLRNIAITLRKNQRPSLFCPYY